MADRYWVGNSGTWNSSNTSNWSTSSGGSGGAAVPTSSDDVHFDANSFSSGGQTVTLSSPPGVQSIDFTGVSNTPTLAGSSALALAAGAGGTKTLIFDAGMILSFTGGISFPTNRDVNVTMAGHTLPGTSSMVFGSAGMLTTSGTLTLVDDCNFGTRSFEVRGGTFDTGGNDFACDSFIVTSGNSGSTAITLNASTVDLAESWVCSSPGTGAITINAGTSLIRIAGPDSLFQGSVSGNKTYYNVQLTVGPDADSSLLSASAGITLTFNNLTFVGTAVKDAGCAVNAIVTVSGTLTTTGSSVTNRLAIRSNVWGTPRTITAAAVSLTNTDFSDITAAGGASPFTGTSLGDLGGNTNITTTAAVTRYWIGNGGNWSDTNHWSTASGGGGGASVPLAQDAVIFDANSFSSGSQVVVLDMPRLGAALTMTGTTNAPTLANTSRTTSLFGSVVLASGVLCSGTQKLYLRARSAITFTSAGVSITFPVLFCWGQTDVDGNVNASLDVSSLTLADDFTSSSLLTIKTGDFDADGFDMTLGAFYLEIPIGRTASETIDLGNGTHTLNGTDIGTGDIYFLLIDDVATTTITSSSANVIINAVAGELGYFQGTGNAASITLATLTINGSVGSVGTVVLFDEMVITTFTIQNDKLTVQFADGVTKTATTFNANGDTGDNITLESFSSGDQWTISAGTATVSYLSVQDSVAAGAAIPFNNTLGGVDLGNNVNWNFGFLPQLSVI